MKLVAESTIFSDEKVRRKFAQLVVDADGIRTEVGKKVGTDEVISRINQSAESVKIQANKVEIEGAAIFSSGRLSVNNLNNAYDSKGAASGAVSDLTSDLASASGTTIINGGHIATGTLDANAVNANSGKFNIANIPDLTADKITSGTIKIGVLPADVKNSNINIGGKNLFIAKNYTPVGCSYANHTLTNTVADTKTGFACYIQVYNGSTYEAILYSASMVSSTGRITATFSSPRAVPAGRRLLFKHNGSAKDIGVYFVLSKNISNGEQLTISYTLSGYNPSTIGGLVIKDIKLERGNKATDWTPAPEDDAATATSYITQIDSAGIFISPFNQSPTASAPGNSVRLNASGLEVFTGGDSVAFYGSTSRIGKSGQTHLEVTTAALNVYSNNGSKIVATLGEYTNGSGRLDIAGVSTGSGAYVYPVIIGLKGSADTDLVEMVGDRLRWGSINTNHKYIQFFRASDFSTLFLDGSTSDLEFNLAGHISTTNRVEAGTRFKSEYCYTETISTDNRVAITSTGNMGKYKSSSRRYKDQIEDATFDPHGLYNLRARQFRYKDGYFALDDDNPHAYDLQVGFIAEEVEQCYPAAAVYDTDTGEIENWEERKMIPPMLTLIQELNDRLTKLEQKGVA